MSVWEKNVRKFTEDVAKISIFVLKILYDFPREQGIDKLCLIVNVIFFVLQLLQDLSLYLFGYQ